MCLQGLCRFSCKKETLLSGYEHTKTTSILQCTSGPQHRLDNYRFPPKYIYHRALTKKEMNDILLSENIYNKKCKVHLLDRLQIGQLCNERSAEERW